MNEHSQRISKRRSTRRGSAVGVALVGMVALILVLTFITAACGTSSVDTTVTTAPAGEVTTTVTGSTGGSVVQVVLNNRSYDPATVTVKVGDTVTWLNQDAPQHDVVADNGEFNSQLFDNGQSFSFTFTEAGTFPYHCSIHPGMEGTVVVQ